MDLGKILLLRPSRAQSSPSSSMDTSTVSSHFSLARSHLELNLTVDQIEKWEDQPAQRWDMYSNLPTPLCSPNANHNRHALAPEEGMLWPGSSESGGITSPLTAFDPAKRPLVGRRDLGSDMIPEFPRKDQPCLNIRKVVDVVDMMAALARLRGAEIIPEGRSAVPSIPSSSGISQAQRTHVDIRKQFWGASAAPRPRSLLLSCQLPDLLCVDMMSSRHWGWAAPDVPRTEKTVSREIFLVSGNDFTRHYAKSFFPQTHALYVGCSSTNEPVVVCVLPNLLDVAGESVEEFMSSETAPSPSIPDKRHGRSDEYQLTALIFSQRGAWETTLSILPSGFRSRLAASFSGPSVFPTLSQLKAALQRDRPDIKSDRISRISGKIFPQFSKKLLDYADRTFPKGFKFGVVYCKAGQAREEEMLRNLHKDASPAYLGFLEWLGPLSLLRGWPHYAGGLDTVRDCSGTHTIHGVIQNPSLSETTFDDSRLELIFHVATLMPFVASDSQATDRKRHIGNDIVTLVFQDRDAPPFSPTSIRTHFAHVYIIVRECTPESYHVGVVSKNNVPSFGPPLPATQYFRRDQTFRKWLYYKLVNAERASLFHPTFRTIVCQARKELLADLIQSIHPQ